MLKSLSVILFLFFFITLSKAQSISEMFIDSTDQAIDASKWLGTVSGFVPLVMPITEPAIGYGAGAGLIFFHPNEFRRAAKEGRFNADISPTPPSLTAIGGLYTETNSWGIGAGHLAVFKEDKLRYFVAGGFASINLNYYSKIFPEKSRGFNMQAWGITNELSMRLNDSDFWLGLGYSFGVLDIEFEKLLPWLGLDLNKIETRNGALFPAISYDNRDNIFTPNQGLKAYMKYGVNAEWLGGTENYQSLFAYTYAYHSWLPGHVTGLRLETQNTFGDPTFIYLPYISLRGVPAMRYQSANTLLGEVEQRIKVYKRWSLVVFGGLAKAYPTMEEWKTEQVVYNYGTGFRYYLAKKFGLHMGMDFAWGPEDFAFYITFGSGWMRL